MSHANVHVVLLSVLAAAQASGGAIQRVSWLQGCWESVTAQRAIEEQWMAPRGTSMLMMGRTVRNGELVDYELVVLKEDGGRLVYEAHPAGQPSAVFHSVDVAAGRVVFENREHDFPQRVGYQQTAPDGLTAWVEGNDHGKERRIEFVYRRARCGG